MNDEWSIEPDPETGEPFTKFDLMTAAVGSWDPYIDDDDVIGWPDEDLDALPEKLRYEIEDGILTVSPRPTFQHQRITFLINAMLERDCPKAWRPVQDAEIRIYEDDHVKQARTPDLVVVPRKLTTGEVNCCWIEPKDAALALEVVSFSSTIADRMTKVALYAEWKIPLYLRVEPKPVPALYEYRFDVETGQYRTPIEHLNVFETDTPFPLRIDLSELR